MQAGSPTEEIRYGRRQRSPKRGSHVVPCVCPPSLHRILQNDAVQTETALESGAQFQLFIWSVSAKTFTFPSGTKVHFSRGTGGHSKNRKYRQTPCFKARQSVESDLMSKFWFLIYLRITWKIGLVFPAITNRTIFKKSTAIDSS